MHSEPITNPEQNNIINFINSNHYFKRPYVFNDLRKPKKLPSRSKAQQQEMALTGG